MTALASCPAETSRQPNGIWRGLSRLAHLMPSRAEPFVKDQGEAVSEDSEAEDLAQRRAAPRQWNPPAWWDHL